MAISHIKVDTIADGTNTDIVRPSDWNSAHNYTQLLSGNTANQSSVSGTDIVLQGGNNITLSGTGSTVIISGPNTVAQSNQTLGLYGVGNTTQNSSTTVDARTLSFDGLGGATVGFSNGSIQISAPQTVAQTVQTVGVYNVGNTTGQSSSSTVDARSLSFDGAGIASVGMSAGSVVVSVPSPPAQTVQTYNVVSASGNTSGTLTTFSTGTMVFAGGNNITLSQASNTITISGAAFPTQTNQTIGLYGVGNTTGQSSSSTVDARSLSFDGAGLVSVGMSAGSVLISVSAAQTVQTIGFYGVGNTTQNSSTTLDARTVSFDGLGGVTVGYSNGSIQISGPQTVAQTVQTVGMYALGNTTQNSSTTFDARTLSFDGLGGITVGYSNGSIQLSGPQTVAQTVQTIGLYGVGNTTQNSSTTLDARTLSFDGLGGATVGFSNGSVQISAPVAQTVQSIGLYGVGNTTQNSSTTLDARTLSFDGLGGATVGFSNGSIQISAPQTVAQTVQTLGIFAVGNTTGQSSSSTIDARSHSFDGAGIASVGMSGGSVVISVPAPAVQTNQTIGLFGVGNTTQNSSTTLDARTLSFDGLGGITVGYSNGSIQLSGPQTVAQTVQTVGMYALGNTTQNSSTTLDARTLSFNGLGGATVGYSNGSIQISGAQTVAQTNQSMGIYAVSNTTGASSSSTIDARSMSFQGAGIASVGMSGGSVVISVPSGGGAGDGVNIISAGGNTSGVLTTFSTGTILFAGGNNITLSQNSNSITLSALASSQMTAGPNVTLSSAGSTITIAGPQLSAFEPREFNHHISYGTPGQNSLWLVPFTLPAAMTISRLNLVVSLNGSTGATASEQVGLTHRVALYTRATGTTVSLSSIFSTSHTARQSANSSTSWLVDWNGNSTSSTNGVGLSAAMTGQKIHTMAMATAISAGDYWIGIMVSSSSVGSSAALQISHAQISGNSNVSFGYPGGTVSTAASLHPMSQGIGTYTATTGAFPGTVHISQINNVASQLMPYFNLMNVGT